MVLYAYLMTKVFITLYLYRYETMDTIKDSIIQGWTELCILLLRINDDDSFECITDLWLKGRRCAYSAKAWCNGLSLQNTLPPYHRICIIIKIAHACMRRVTPKEKQNMVLFVPLLSFPLRLKVTFCHKSASQILLRYYKTLWIW